MKFPLVLITLLLASDLAGQGVTFTVPEKDIIPEGITHDPVTGDFFLSSIFKNKIVRVSDGKASDYIQSGQAGFMGGVGLHVDTKRRILWAVSGNIMGKKFRRGVHAFDMTTGKLLKQVTFPVDTLRSFYNDLVIADDGAVYLTDTFGHGIWKWGLDMESPDKKETNPVKLALDEKVEWPNGITITPDNEYLFVAAGQGLKRINITTGHVELIPMPEGVITSRGLDGIEFYKNSIVGVQNGHDKNSDMKVIRYYLSGDLDRIERTEVIDSGNKYFNIPTTLVIVNDELYVLANSQLNNLDQENMKIKAPEKLTETFILKYTLK